MARRKKKTLEDYLNEGVDIQDAVREVTILPHTSSLKGNSFDARLIISFEMPDGRWLSHNTVRRIRITETSDDES